MKKMKQCGVVFLAAFFPLTEAAKQTFLILHGYDWWYFPFQLCSMPAYFLPLYIFSRWLGKTRPQADRAADVLRDFLADFSLLGGMFAFFDTSGMHYAAPLLTVHSFAWHIFMILLGLLLTLEEKKKFLADDGKNTPDRMRKKTRFLPEAILLSLCMLFAEFFNIVLSRFGQLNMFYISPRMQMRQVCFEKIAAAFGNAAGIFLYALAIFLGGYLIHRMRGRLLHG